MLYRSLKSLNKLEVVEKRERLVAEANNLTPTLEVPLDFFD